MSEIVGKTASLKKPFLGYYNIRIIRPLPGYQWECEILGSGKLIPLYEDEFIID